MITNTITIGNEPAFPTTEHDGNGGTIQGFGFTKREQFAMAAMQGILANPNQLFMSDIEVGQKSVDLADALIAALNEGGNDNGNV